MLAPVFSLLKADSGVFAKVGTRIYRHGSAPQNVVKPYITWYTVTGMPEVQLSGAPCIDMDSIQIDCWSDSDSEIEVLAYAVRKALDDAKIVNRIVQNNREDDTRLFHIAVEADFIHSSR